MSDSRLSVAHGLGLFGAYPGGSFHISHRAIKCPDHELRLMGESCQAASVFRRARAARE